MDQYYEKGGPIFLMLGGEGPASEKWMRTGAWVEVYAAHLGAYCVQIEHRFYGDSHPTKDLSVQSLQYLSSEQALADAAKLIVNITAELGLDIEEVRFKFDDFSSSTPPPDQMVYLRRQLLRRSQRLDAPQIPAPRHRLRRHFRPRPRPTQLPNLHRQRRIRHEHRQQHLR